MFGGLNLKEDNTNKDDTKITPATTPMSGFSFMLNSNNTNVDHQALSSGTNTTGSSISTRSIRNQSDNDKVVNVNLNEDKNANTNSSSSSSSSGFSFLNNYSAIDKTPASTSITIENGGIHSPTISSTNTSASARTNSGGLFDQLNFATNGSGSNINKLDDEPVSSAPVDISTSVIVPEESEPTEAVVMSMIKVQSSASGVGVTRKKKRSVKIGGGLAQSSRQDGMDQNVSGAGKTKSSDYIVPVVTSSPSIEVEVADLSAVAPHSVSNEHENRTIVSSESDQGDEVLQRAQAAAKLAMQMEKEESRERPSTGSFFKNPFWGGSKNKHSSASSHSYQQHEHPELSPKSTNKCTAKFTTEADIEKLSEVAPKIPDQISKVSDIKYDDMNESKLNLEKSVSVSDEKNKSTHLSTAGNTSLVSRQTVSEIQEKISTPSPMVHKEEYPPVPPVKLSSSIGSYHHEANVEPPSPISSKDSLSTKSTKLRRLQAHMIHTLSNATSTLHSNLESLRLCQTQLAQSTNDEFLHQNKIKSLQSQIEDLVEREEYETAEVMNEEVALIEAHVNEFAKSCTADKEQIETCRIWHKEHIHNVQSLFLDYKRELKEMLNVENSAGENVKELSIAQLREEKSRLDANLSEIEADEVEIEKERADLEDLVAKEVKVFVDENLGHQTSCNKVMVEIEELEKALAEKRAEADGLIEIMKLNNDKIAKERGKHEFRFKKLSTLELSLKTTKSEYEQVVLQINEKLKDAEEFQDNVIREESVLSDVLANVLPIALDYSSSCTFPDEYFNDDEGISELRDIQQQVLRSSSNLASAELELQTALSSQKDTKSKKSAIESSLPQLESEKVQAASDRNFKLAAGLNRQIKDMKVELVAIRKEQLVQEDHLDHLKDDVKEKKSSLAFATDRMKVLESEMLFSKLAGVKKQLLICRENVIRLKETQCELLMSFFSANEIYWDSVGMELSSKCSINWEAFLEEGKDVTESGVRVEPKEEDADVSLYCDPEWIASIKVIVDSNDSDSLSLLLSTTKNQINNLDERLADAVETEDYEEAAEIDEELNELRTKLRYLCKVENQAQSSAKADRSKSNEEGDEALMEESSENSHAVISVEEDSNDKSDIVTSGIRTEIENNCEEGNDDHTIKSTEKSDNTDAALSPSVIDIEDEHAGNNSHDDDNTSVEESNEEPGRPENVVQEDHEANSKSGETPEKYEKDDDQTE